MLFEDGDWVVCSVEGSRAGSEGDDGSADVGGLVTGASRSWAASGPCGTSVPAVSTTAGVAVGEPAPDPAPDLDPGPGCDLSAADSAARLLRQCVGRRRLRCRPGLAARAHPCRAERAVPTRGGRPGVDGVDEGGQSGAGRGREHRPDHRADRDLRGCPTSGHRWPGGARHHGGQIGQGPPRGRDAATPMPHRCGSAHPTHRSGMEGLQRSALAAQLQSGRRGAGVGEHADQSVVTGTVGSQPFEDPPPGGAIHHPGCRGVHQHHSACRGRTTRRSALTGETDAHEDTSIP